jgi:hypothetical protein
MVTYSCSTRSLPLTILALVAHAAVHTLRANIFCTTAFIAPGFLLAVRALLRRLSFPTDFATVPLALVHTDARSPWAEFASVLFSAVFTGRSAATLSATGWALAVTAYLPRSRA